VMSAHRKPDANVMSAHRTPDATWFQRSAVRAAAMRLVLTDG